MTVPETAPRVSAKNRVRKTDGEVPNFLLKREKARNDAPSMAQAPQTGAATLSPLLQAGRRATSGRVFSEMTDIMTMREQKRINPPALAGLEFLKKSIIFIFPL